MNESPATTTAVSPFRKHWLLETGLAFLNHGSFGACPREILDYQRELLALMERDPVRFFNRHRQPLLDESRRVLGDTIGANPSDLVFDTNATHAANAVLRWLDIREGDEILVTSHGYNAITNAARYVAAQAGAEVITAEIPLVISSSNEITQAIEQAITPRTRLAILDHITSPTATVLPLEDILPLLREQRVLSLIDGAHAPGAIPLNLANLGADFYFGNCHKWLCSPRGAAFSTPRRNFDRGQGHPSSSNHHRSVTDTTRKAHSKTAFTTPSISPERRTRPPGCASDDRSSF